MPHSWTSLACMDGWWQCSECGREVDEKIWGSECPDCSHHKCDRCTAIEGARIAGQIHSIDVHAVGQHTGFAGMTGRWEYDDNIGISIHGGRGLIRLHLQGCDSCRYSAFDLVHQEAYAVDIASHRVADKPEGINQTTVCGLFSLFLPLS